MTDGPDNLKEIGAPMDTYSVVGGARGGATEFIDVLGMVLTTMDSPYVRQSEREPCEGLVVTEVRAGSVAALSGIESGDVITEVDGLPARTFADLEGSLVGRCSRTPIRILLRGSSSWRFVTVPSGYGS